MSESTLRTWVHGPVSPEVRAALERLARIEDVAVVAAMPDIHLSHDVCVGSVVGTRSRLYPDAVGGDIGCGVSAVPLTIAASVLGERSTAAKVLSVLSKRIPTSSRASASAELPERLVAGTLSAPILEQKKRTVGRTQFATLGRGNHFVELQRDSEDGLWLMLHSGSRGIGQGIREHHATGETGLSSIEAESEQGRAYLRDVEWALEYARLSRRWMAETAVGGIRNLIGGDARWESYIDCHHNFVRREEHNGQHLWVHRKGAISARDGESGIIPGSMGSASFHVLGRGNPKSLCSSSHGAGREMSRTEARRCIDIKDLTKQMTGVWFDHRIARRLRDEAPRAYKDIRKVMRAQRDLTRIRRELHPVLVYKGI